VSVSPSAVQLAVLKRYKSLGIDQILAELNQAGGNTLLYEIQKTYYLESGSIARAVEGLYYCTNKKKGNKTNNYLGIYNFQLHM
jgi:hypothetical protein